MEAGVVRGFEKLMQNHAALQFMDGLLEMR